MFEAGIVLLICHTAINGSFGQVTVEKQYPNLLLQLGIRAGVQEPSTKILKNYVTPSKGCKIALQDSVRVLSDEQLECTNSQIVRNSGLPLVELGDGFYYFGTYLKANFFKAMEFCKAHGMDLLSIESNEENTRIINFISTRVSNVDHWWTSGCDLGEEGHFVWLATGKPLNFSYWSPPQPDNAGNVENCLEIWKLGDKHFVWNDIPCTNTYNFICEVRRCSNFCIN